VSERILDASALLALLNEEQGSELVSAALIDGAVMSTVNLSEVVAKLSDGGMPASAIDEVLASLSLDVVDFSRDQARRAGLLRPSTRNAGLSLGDRACLTLALDRRQLVLTTDRTWASLAIDVEIQLVR